MDQNDQADPAAGGVASTDRERQVRQWAMFLHLSTLAGYIVFGAGFVAPVLIWQLKKHEYPELEQHGKIVVNWLISYVIYMAICVVLSLAVIGFFLAIAMGVVGVIFPIVGGIKANNGEAWKYPLSIPILS